jgi:hypothetical protein
MSPALTAELQADVARTMKHRISRVTNPESFGAALIAELEARFACALKHSISG